MDQRVLELIESLVFGYGEGEFGLVQDGEDEEEEGEAEVAKSSHCQG